MAQLGGNESGTSDLCNIIIHWWKPTDWTVGNSLCADNGSCDKQWNLGRRGKKVKLKPEQAVKSQARSTCIARWGWIVNASPRPFYPREWDPVPTVVGRDTEFYYYERSSVRSGMWGVRLEFVGTSCAGRWCYSAQHSEGIWQQDGRWMSQRKLCRF